MRMLATLLLALAQVVGGPTQVQDPAYPIRVRILGRNVSQSANGTVKMWGRGDIFEPIEQGFDYQTDCSIAFMRSEGEERYSARWKKQDKELEILVSRIGTGKSDKCVLRVDLKPFIYDVDNDRHVVVTKPMAK
jgi:hypothetical protein